MILPLHGHLHGARLSAFVDGELDHDEAHRWRLHLMACTACSAAVSEERAVRARIRHAGAPPPPSTLVMSLRVVAVTGRCAEVPDTGPRARPGGGVVRRLPVGVLAATTTVAAAAVVGLAVTALAPPPGSAGTPRPAAAVTVAPAALLPAAVPAVPATLTRAPAATELPAGFPVGTTGTVTATMSSGIAPTQGARPPLLPLATAQR